MTELLTSAQMRAIEQAAIASGEVTGLDLMERAGRGVVEAVFAEWPELAAAPQRAVVLCGPGNNGGDGFVVARLLKQWGWEVAVFLYGEPETLPPDAQANYTRWLDLGDVAPLSAATLEAPFPGRCALLVDALFGTGLGRPVALPLSALAPGGGPSHRVVAVDLPSGLCGDSGRVIGEDAGAVRADLTVSFHAMKLGHVLAQGPDRCGKVAVQDIGLDFILPEILPPEASGGSAGPVGLAGVTPASLGKYHATHKYSHGHALIVAGRSEKGGAGRLAARGAIRAGAGLVTLGCPTGAVAENAAQLNAIMLRRLDDAKMLAGVLEDERINALCLGPGLGVGRDTRALVEVALAAQRAVLLDADALTSFADAPEDLFARLHPRCVLTPHGGEFARLFPAIAERLAAPAVRGPAYSRVDAARAAAAQAGCVVLFKGADTVIAAPDGACRVNAAHYDRAAPWLATAGSGDVLAGFVTGLLARDFAPMQAAGTGAWLHVEAARKFGPGLIAEDLPEMLPAVFRDLGL